MITHINLKSESKNLKKDYTSIFNKIVRAAIAADVANDPRPFDMARFDAYKKNLDTALLAANLQEIRPPLSTAGALCRTVTAPTAAPTTRPSQRRGTAKEGAATGPPRPCFHCNKPGHTAPNCKTKKTPASLATAEKRKKAYILARDARRAAQASTRARQVMRTA